MNIRFLGAHNMESSETRHTCLMVDSLLVIDAGSLTSRLTFEAMAKIQGIALTHQHPDHIKDLPAIGMNLLLLGKSTNIYCQSSVEQALCKNIFNGDLYPNFFEVPQGNPTFKYCPIEHYTLHEIAGLKITAMPVNHIIPCVGYLVESQNNETLFYSGDTGPGLSNIWQTASPELLIIEVTLSDRFQAEAIKYGHLTPSLLKAELISFKEIRGYFPRVVTMHTNQLLEREIHQELDNVSTSLNALITMANEKMDLEM